MAEQNKRPGTTEDEIELLHLLSTGSETLWRTTVSPWGQPSIEVMKPIKLCARTGQSIKGRIEIRRTTLTPTVYLLGEEGELLTFSITEEAAKHINEAINKQVNNMTGQADPKQPIVLENMTPDLFKATPVTLDGEPVDFVQVAASAALQVAEDKGDKELQEKILNKVFRRIDNESATDPNETDEGEQGEDIGLPVEISPTLKQDAGIVADHVDPISKLANLMTNPGFFEGVNLDVASRSEKRKGKEVTTVVTFSWDEGIQTTRDISEYDRAINAAYATLWANGLRNVTVAQFAKALGIPNPTKKQLQKVEESIELQRRIMATVDFSEQARGAKLEFEGEKIVKCEVEGHLIEAIKTTFDATNGKKVVGYALSERPPIVYYHAAAFGEVVTYPQRYLSMGSGSATERNTLLRAELLRRVRKITRAYKKASTKKRDSVQRVIVLTENAKGQTETALLTRAGVPSSNRHATQAAVALALEILDELAGEGEIIGYEKITKKQRGGGLAVTAVKLTL